MKVFESWKALVVVLILGALVASLNVIVRRLAPVRWDTTEGKVYTLTDGTRAILKRADESGRPVTIRFYLSNEEDVQLPKNLVEYSRRVKDLLEEYAKASGNTIAVQTYEPEPNSVEAESANIDGIMYRDPRMDLPRDGNLDQYDYDRTDLASQHYFFGLSVSSLDKTEIIPYLDPKEEKNLEYNISRAIAAVTRKSKRKIGLLEGSEMGLAGSPGMMGGPGRPPSVIHRHLSKDFDVVSVPFDVGPMKPDDKDHPFADLDLLLIVHPIRVNRPQSPNPQMGIPPMGATTLDFLSDETQYAIDQYLVGGGKAVAFLDNQYFISRYFDACSPALPFSPGAPKFLTDIADHCKENGWPHHRSGLDRLTDHWGISLQSDTKKNPLLFDPKNTRANSFSQPQLRVGPMLANLLNSIPREFGRQRQMVIDILRSRWALLTRFNKESLTKDHAVTRELNSLMMVDPSPILGKPKGGLKMKSLVRSSEDSMLVANQVAREILSVSNSPQEVTGRFQNLSAKNERYPVAVILEGKFKSAFKENPVKKEEAIVPDPAPPIPENPEPPFRPPLLPDDAPDNTENNPTPENSEAPPENTAPENGENSSTENNGETEGSTSTPGDEGGTESENSNGEAPKEESSEPGEPDEGEFPNPQPPTENESESGPEEEAPAGEEKEEEDFHVAEGSKEGTIAIISDVDMLFDYFLGDPEMGGRREHDNVSFILNLVDTLAGDTDLASIRGRDSTSRPFTVINDIRDSADEKAAGPRAEIEKTKKELMDKRMEASQGSFFFTMDEKQLEEDRDYQHKLYELERETNKINREQRKGVQAAINRYNWINMLVMPIVVIIIGLTVGFIRKTKTAAK